ncbi:glycerol-3-phosphate acyltransferase 4-like [Salvelinus namaycush]|uniref:Glycerol-3-phosphate acyltransferase 4-like n=1 Tax=Salvelinus namaycush TaxID=8040 RepID=A0A8U0QJZ8_SALNM|nr:glycerol-3-phosphate acyltransferase 4-like [Salvelinus namaycush]
MGWFLIPFDNLLCMVLGISFTVGFSSLLVIVVPAVLGVSIGIRRLYMKSLLKVFEWATVRMERGAKEKNQHLYKPYSNGIIAKELSSLEQEIQELRASGTTLSSEPEFEMADIMYFCRRGVESIVDDEVTKRFSAQELESWNLLTRSNFNARHISLRLSVLWGLGLFIRYGFLLPLRVTLAASGIGLLVVLTTIVGFIPSGWLRTYLSEKIHLMSYRICVRSLTAIITYHNSENKPKNGGICVANHTTPIDVIILANDGCYSMVGQIHGGLIGVVQRAMVKSSPHIWFERSEVKDRHLVAERLSNHVADKTKHPILIFPEGTCINNTSVMMFKKGSFEIGCTFYPVAIKYDPRFGDAFWNSSKFGMVNYLLRMMSSWAIVCSVWYLPPMSREEGEDAVQFANRVKAAIATQGGLVDLLWDGGLKRGKVKNTFKEEQQKLYSKVLVGDQEDQGEDRPQEDEEEEEGDQNEDRPLEDYTPRPLEDCSLRLQEEEEERGSETPMKDQ